MIYKAGYLICFLLLNVTILFAQEWNISLKPGAAIGIAAPFPSKGYAYKTTSYLMPRPQLCIFLSKTGKSGNTAYFIGAGLQPVTNSFDFNEKNINLSKSYGGSLEGGEYAFQLYAGLEKKLNKNNAPAYRNYFSVMCGIGLNHYILRTEENRGIRIFNFAETKNGQLLTGTEFGYSGFVVGAPSVFTGLRYNITNSTGKSVAAVELAANFGVIRYFNHKISYQIDGEDKVDYLSEKGWNIQFSVIIPVAYLSRKKSKSK